MVVVDALMFFSFAISRAGVWNAGGYWVQESDEVAAANVRRGAHLTSRWGISSKG
jgi:hypothetical protein